MKTLLLIAFFNLNLCLNNINTTPAAIFPGGNQALQLYLQDNLNYPTEARENGMIGTVTVAFDVQSSGELTNITIEKGVCKEIDNEVIRVIKAMPNWKVSKQNEATKSTTVRLNVQFELEI